MYAHATVRKIEILISNVGAQTYWNTKIKHFSSKRRVFELRVTALICGEVLHSGTWATP